MEARSDDTYVISEARNGLLGHKFDVPAIPTDTAGAPAELAHAVDRTSLP